MLGFLTSRLAGPIASGVAVLLLAALAYVWIDSGATIRALGDQVTAITAQRDAARSDLTQSRANGIALTAALERQNAAVDALRAAGEARTAELTRLAADARRSAASARARADAILARPGTGDACADARALILETVR